MEAQVMKERPIGVFDSGLGGLTVVRELTRVLPGEDIVYLGDSARVPYGIRSLETVRRFSMDDASFLLRYEPKMIVVACNTASAAALDALKEFCPVEVVGTVLPGAAEAVEVTRDKENKAVGVIATEATIQSGAYLRAIRQHDGERAVYAQSCPLLVPIVEEGRSDDDPIVLSVLHDYLREMQRKRLGALILGCTHYPLLTNAIAKVMGPDVSLISSGRAAAKEVQRRLSLSNLLSSRSYGGRLRCFTTDNPERFNRLGERFGGRRIDQVERVPIDELESRHPATTEIP
jgi:glutamate racemase